VTVVTGDMRLNTYTRWPIEFSRGQGSRLFDVEGREYIDLVAGIAVTSVGHSHPRVVGAISRQAQDLIHVSNLYETSPQRHLAQRLGELSSGMSSFFCNSGAESIECALKLARKWGDGRSRIIAADGSFHGRTFGALAATGQPAKRLAFEPNLPGITHVPYGDIDALRSAIAADVCAVLLEPIQGEAGVVIPPTGYFAEVRHACDEAGVLLILDEVQTGLGRTGRWFAHLHEGVAPDVMCLAKALGSGLPIGACLAAPHVAGAFRPGDHASTFGGGPVVCAAALATLDVLEDEGLVERSARLGAAALDRLGKTVGDRAPVRGKGLLIGIEVGDGKARTVAGRAFDRGVLVNDATPDVVRVCPALNIGEEELDGALDVVGEAIHEV
jgi:predicted acetylornithine/succinylornithine family transaminase